MPWGCLGGGKTSGLLRLLHYDTDALPEPTASGLEDYAVEDSAHNTTEDQGGKGGGVPKLCVARSGEGH